MGRIVFSSQHSILKTAFASVIAIALSAGSANAATPQAIVGALRLSGIITGGTMPTNSADFTTMVSQVETNDHYGAALTAIQSQYGTAYLLRRLAFQMQNSNYDASTVTDSDATAYLMAHFAGVGGVGAPSISKVWSNNMTCSVRVTRNGAPVVVKAADLTPAEKNTIDWRAALVCTAGQSAIDLVATNAAVQANRNALSVKTTIPIKHVGGYTTLSDRLNDNSFAETGAMAGTNLRYIENLWMVATGMDILAFASAEARPQQVPKFIPENDPHFLIGGGQTACISCHGGGLAALNHGYSTLADTFDYTTRGFSYNSTPTVPNLMKSLGSDPATRGQTQTCNLAQFTLCNPDSVGADPNQAWELSSNWGARGVLTRLGWNGATAGLGLNALGVAIGKAGAIYSNMVKRVIREVCPLGAIPDRDITQITQAVQVSDDIKLMIAQVASNAACR